MKSVKWHVARLPGALVDRLLIRKSDWVIFVTGRNSHHHCYDVSYQCWFASEEAKIYCNNFNSSNAVVCSHLILAYTVRLAIMNAVELEQNGCSCFFFTFIEEMLCCDWKEHRQKSLQIELVTKYDTKNAYKESLVGGPNLRRGGSISASGFGPGGSKSAVTPAFQERNQGWNTRSHFNLYFHESSKHFKRQNSR